ncbi:glycerophosphotransferase [Allostella vacuolata]|nr:glycerophosphotransferase [Stella vacuolata]
MPTEPALRIAFLFNAQFHQILHSLPIACAMAAGHAAAEVSILAPTAAHFAFVARYLPPAAAGRLRFVDLGSPAWLRLYRALSGDLAAGKKAILAHNRALLAGFDALVVPERTSAYVKELGLPGLKLVHTGHGAGDRERSFNPEIRKYDFVLLSGRKYEERLLAQGLIRPGHYAVAGYSKFDLLLDRPPPDGRRLFANDRPTVLYAPHFDPRVSSWPKLGPALLEQALARPNYNLIFAPHVRLFDPVRWWKRLPFRRFAAAPNILVDLGSDCSVDMTYTNAADVYAGDVSSQVYEFIARPRPCVFLNAHRADWEKDPFYLCWRGGPVIEDVAAFPAALQTALDRFERYRPEQEALFAHTFDLDRRPSAERAADAIVAFLERGRSTPGR